MMARAPAGASPDRLATDPPYLTLDQTAPEATLAGRIAARLKSYPHFCILTGLEPSDDHAPLKDLCRAVAQAGRPTPTEKPLKTSFTRVQISNNRRPDGDWVTRFSRTHQPMALHTDSSYKTAPHELIAFQMVRADAAGGDTLVAAVEDVVTELGPSWQSRLSRPDYPFGEDHLPILWQAKGAPCIRYYRAQIDTACADGKRLSWRQRVALEAMDQVLRHRVVPYRFRLRPGQILFLHNLKALHGRTGFDANSDRLMYRVRVRAVGLD